MKTIAYYISDYGFGHATRSVALIRQLLKMEEDVRVIICHSFALQFLRESLKDENRVTFRKMETDIGYVLQKDSIEPDIEKLNVEYKKYLKKWNFLIEQERNFLQTNGVDFVISDISAFPFEAAYMLGIPSIGISNFTWYTAYQRLIADPLLEPLKKSYEKMTYFFSLAGSQEPDWGTKGTKQFGFFAREVDGNEVNRIRKLVNPTGDQFVAFFGLGMKIDIDQLERLPIWDSPNCTFIVSSNVQVKKPNVFSIPKDYIESQHYIAAADLVISKPGWGIVSEAVCARKPLLILDRQTMKEDQNTISYLKENHLCKTITWKELHNFVIDEAFMKKMRSQYPFHNTFFSNQADMVSKQILQVLRNKNDRI
ncbi:hypothetical protein [Parageobacillus galactosidasius]|uniref:Glycosyl transferase family 28 C-terminal domain-containing protein n=1 Tax=Parageobacillus galactosidasius TaxID=883812 RepID=A0A226QN27_9BACL|nr:hypothetical protein [Parageobacillus galactosidasius]OXB93117.1 hypothetical protein B9L23_18615 [Parageobacillus galactosidasius]